MGLDIKENGIARGPKTAPITLQKTGLLPRLFAMAWQNIIDTANTTDITIITIMRVPLFSLDGTPNVANQATAGTKPQK